ncbi:MAG TPA: hypothetical protein VFG14_13790, partial [Chthoniobacteraceae bacterium]|nr:hypothetical protein [Chthoniobacteraceae bacterium]
AQAGSAFFIKWMICAGAQVVMASFAQKEYLFGTTQFVAEGRFDAFQCIIPAAFPAWALFGFTWRFIAWIAAVALVYTLPFFSTYLPPSYPVILIAALHCVLLFGKRRRPVIWLFAFPATNAINLYDSQADLLRMIWNAIRAIPFTGSWSVVIVWNWFQMLTAIILGATLAWLMPPTVPSPEAESDGVVTHP